MTAYRAIVIEHFRHPRNRGPLENADASADGANPLCGDRIRVQIAMDHGRISRAGFTADACALCIAAASVLTEHVSGLTPAEAAAVCVDRVHEALGGEPPPARAKCATLPVDTFHRALSMLDGAKRKSK